MNTKIIKCHHGSPGSPSDFHHLAKLLPQYQLQTIDRTIKPKAESKNEISYQLGYSFGSLFALLEGNQNANTKHIILIAPYLYPEKKPSPIMKFLLQKNFFKDNLLPKLAKGKILKMLQSSSFPQLAPETYINDAKDYLTPSRLALSILEKDTEPQLINKAIEELSHKNILITIIVGEDDQTSKKNQIAFIEKFKNVNIVKIKDAGHALLWTHTSSVAQIIDNLKESDMSTNEKLGYFNGFDKRNNVASFLTKHKKNFPKQKILTWIAPQDLQNWKGEIENAPVHQSVTVEELDYMVGVLSHEFKKHGIKFNDRVILFLPMSLYMYASMFALQKMGAIPTFLDSWARRDQMGVSASVAMPTAMISSDRAYQYLSDVPEIHSIPIKIVAGPINSSIKYTAQLENLVQGKNYDEEVAVEKEHTALITFTTGSSGTPKGADRSHRFLAAQHYALDKHLPYEKSDKDLPVFPIFSLNNIAAGVETIIPAIDVGAPAETDGALLYAQLKTGKVTCTTLSPSLFNGLANFCIEKNIKLDFLKRVVTGGAPISRDDVARMKKVAPNAAILVLYGSTEVEPMAHIEATEMLAESQSNDPEIVEMGVNVGHIDSGLKYRFIEINKETVTIKSKDDWKKIEVKVGDVGELIVAGEHVCEKYFNNEEAFFRAKIRDENNIVWHRTGDLGLVDKNNLWIVGRVHNAIKRKNIYYFPVRAEIILKKFPFVHKAAFLGVPDKDLNEKTYAVFTTHENSGNIEQYKSEIKRVLVKNGFIVDEVIHTSEIPMDPRHHSKVEYDVLRKKLIG